MQELRFKKFTIGEIFEELPVGYKGSGKKIGSATKEPDAEHVIPLTCAKMGDNGIMYWGRKGDFITYENAISVIADGAVSTGRIYAQPEEAGAYSHSYFIRVKDVDVTPATNFYLAATLEKVIYPIYSREHTPRWKRIKDDVIELPVDQNGEPDWDYMDKYIRGIEEDVLENLIQECNQYLRVMREVIDDIN